MLSGPLTRSVWVWELDTQSLHVTLSVGTLQVRANGFGI